MGIRGRGVAGSSGAEGTKAQEAAAAELPSSRGEGAAVVAEATAALLDDLNTPAAVAALSGPLKAVNDLLTTKAGRKQPNRCAGAAGRRGGRAGGGVDGGPGRQRACVSGGWRWEGEVQRVVSCDYMRIV